MVPQQELKASSRSNLLTPELPEKDISVALFALEIGVARGSKQDPADEEFYRNRYEPNEKNLEYVRLHVLPLFRTNDASRTYVRRQVLYSI